MKTLTRQVRKLAAPLLIVPAVAAGFAGGAMVLAGSPAGAASCNGATSTSCTDTGTLSLSAGALTVTPPSSLGWAATLAGTTTYSVDTTAADEGYEVDDNTGSGAGWHIGVSATTFTAGSNTLPDSGTFSVNGSTSSYSSTSAPSAACVSTCTLPSNSTTYPVAITTAASSPSSSTIYDTAASSGLGDITIGGSGATDPVGWWLTIPPTAKAGTYTSTITFSVTSGP